MSRKPVPTSVRARTVRYMRRARRALLCSEIADHIDAPRANVSVVLGQLVAKGEATKAGGRFDMVYTLVDVETPAKAKPKVKAKAEPRKPSVPTTQLKPKQAVRANDCAPPAEKVAFVKPKVRPPDPPTLILCSSCDTFGRDRDCTDCRMEVI